MKSTLLTLTLVGLILLGLSSHSVFSKDVLAACGTCTLGPGDYDESVQHDGNTRIYLVHVPSSYNTNKETPLILAFHGAGSSGERMADNDTIYKLITKSDQEGFIVAFPNGTRRSVRGPIFDGRFGTWNAGNCCGYASEVNIDDVGFVNALLDDIETKFNIDTGRVYATGISNGGMLSYRLACELADRFVAIASVAGTENIDTCSPSRPIPVMHIHSLSDAIVPFYGGDFTSVPETINRWVTRNNCDPEPERVDVIGSPEDGNAYSETYNGCSQNVQVKLWVTVEGGHSWPGGQGSTQVISATDEMWNFFQGAFDSDGDGIPDDGNNSGVAGDSPCTGGEKENCDDNCIDHCNFDQLDADVDGIGDVCDDDPGCGKGCEPKCEQGCITID